MQVPSLTTVLNLSIWYNAALQGCFPLGFAHDDGVCFPGCFQSCLRSLYQLLFSAFPVAGREIFRQHFNQSFTNDFSRFYA